MSATLPAWRSGPAILPTLRAWSGPTLCELPDEPAGTESGVRFAAGAWDGILGHHSAGVDEQEEARLVGRLLDALLRLIRDNDDEARGGLYELLQGESLVRHVDVFLRELVDQKEAGPADVLPHARWLMRNAPHRNPLKFGIALTGVCGDPADLDDLRVLARHDEFTLYAAVAAANLVDDPVAEWWKMAREVRGWGKVHLVERLCRHVGERDDLRGWLLRHGCANEVMNEYLALDCAVAGDLAGALASDDVDDALLDGAGVILLGLLSEDGPAGDIDSYPDGVSAAEHYLRHLETRCTTLARLRVVNRLSAWLNNDDEETWDRRADLGWTPMVREEIQNACREILARKDWPSRVRAAFAGDEEERRLAWELSEAAGVDLWDEAFAALASSPTNSWLYGVLCQTDNPDRAARVLAFAEGHLPLAEVAAGSSGPAGFGPGFAVHACLDALLTRMARGGAYSEAAVAAALRSPVVRNRHLAAGVLETRPREEWGPQVEAAFEKARAEETNEQMRERWRMLRP